MEKFVTFRFAVFILVCCAMTFVATPAFAQADTIIGQITNSASEAYAGGMSGDGRFVVFESRGNLATENPRNSDGNTEIFLFDYAQRRIFQITDTKSVLFETSLPATFNNVRIAIVNTRPVISNDGKYIAFSSNATIAYPGDGTNPPIVSSTNPGSFDGNAFTTPTPTPSPSPSPTPTPGANVLTKDANLEIWIYQIPAVAPVANLSLGDEIPFAELAGGTFTRVTNTIPSQLPRPGSATQGAYIADDNHDASISDDGGVIAFVSTRDNVPAVGNSFPLNEDNDEVFTYLRATATLNQVTKTPRGPISNPIYNKNVTISGNGLRVAFASTGDDPIDDPLSATNFDTGSNPASSRNEEIFYANLNASGVPTGGKQVTTTTPTNAGDPVNILDLGKRMSRDGKLIAFDSYADLANENSGTNYTSFATYLYDVTANTTRRIAGRSDADSGAQGGDVQRYAGFTDYDGSGAPSTLLLETRMNMKPDGSIPSTASDGLNPNADRPSQLYSYPLNVAASSANFTRMTKFATPSSFIASTQALTSDSLKRFAFNLALSELGGGNSDLSSEVYYLIAPTVLNTAAVTYSMATGATRQSVSQTVVPTPTPTATPTPTPTPSPSPTPTPTPIPVTPNAVFGVAPGMLASLSYQAGFDRPIVPRSGVGSLNRSFNLPIELSGVSLTINGFACGLRYVNRHRIDFLVPPGLTATSAGTKYPLVIQNNGTVLKSEVVLVPSRPDIFNTAGTEGPGGRAKVFNITNRVFTTEPFNVRTIRVRPSGRVPSILRLYLTGIQPGSPANISVKIGNSASPLVPVTGTVVQVEPGIYTLDFALKDDLAGAGDVPVVVTVSVDGISFASRLDDTTSRIRIL